MTNPSITFRQWVEDGMPGIFTFEHRGEEGVATLVEDEHGNGIVQVLLPGILGRYLSGDDAVSALSVVHLTWETVGSVSETEEPAEEEPAAAEEDS